MDRIVIIGLSGAGKTTLARMLGRKLKIQVFHLDRRFWHPGWKRKSRGARKKILDDLVSKKRWIIEGSYLNSIDTCLKRADTIIFLDIPLHICLNRIIRRHYECRGQHRHDLKVGCPDKLTPIRILKVIFFPIRGRRKLINKLKRSKTKDIIWLHSPKEVEVFLTQLGQQATDDQFTSKASSETINRHPAFA